MKRLKLDYNIINGDISNILQIAYNGEVFLEFKKFTKAINQDFKAELKIRDLAIKQLEKEKQELINKIEFMTNYNIDDK